MIVLVIYSAGDPGVSGHGASAAARGRAAGRKKALTIYCPKSLPLVMRTFIAVLAIVVSSFCAFGAELSGAEFGEQLKTKASGDFLVTDTVGRISSSLTQGQFSVQVGGQALAIQIPVPPGDRVSMDGNAIVLSHKRTSAQHAVGSRFDKSILLQSGQPATFLVRVSAGRVSSAKIASQEDRIALKFKDAAAQPGGAAAVNSEIQARTLLLEIQQLEGEIKSGVAGKSKVSGSTMYGEGFNATVTQKFTPEQIAAKTQLLELKRAQLRALTAQ